MTAGSPSRLERPGGHWLAVRDWPLAARERPRAQVLLVHGLGEHVGRYAHVAQHLRASGCAVRGYDQYGHGESSGRRGDLPEGDRLLTDLAAMLDDTRRAAAGLPLVLLGHSMGGLVAARLVSLALRPVDALVLSSPALDAGLTRLQRALAQVLGRVAPHLRLGNGIDPHGLSRDAAAVQAYVTDPLVHDRISARLALFIADAGPAVLAAAPHWTVPTLLLWAGEDRAVDPAGSARFAELAPRGVVTARPFPEHRHELFNDRDRDVVFVALGRWLGAQLAPQ
ncbi:MAG TPA: alpha/beta hydrolase [Ottowia sp.]|uniref:alpha/beta hydrolase n=1 Tax=Ottowia sp. TaxID=1898956 RepID=UPI002C8D98C2|nr:lysophospholipase [Ottowia sp.]HMN20878.1 alpha/beta hydrolase [Ottowia sp.]